VREIKFRAWHKRKREMFDVSAIQFREPRFVVKMNSLETYILDEVELMQYTGLKDKAGKAIYEGDIVSNGDWEGEVRYSEQCVGYEPFACDGEGDHECHYYWGDYWQVIGNIYETPELLEKASV